MSSKRPTFTTLNHVTSLDETHSLEAKLGYLKTLVPKISYSEVSFSSEIKCVAVTPDEKFAIAGLENGEVQIVSIVTSDEEFESGKALIGHKSEVKCLCVTNDSQFVISGSYDKCIIIWNILEQKQAGLLKGSEDKVLAMAISKDNTLLISSSIDNIIRIWDLQKLEQKTVIRSIERNCYTLEVTDNNNFLILGCSDNLIRLWNIAEHRQEAKFEGHTWPVYSLSLTSDGQYLISAGMDHTIRKWDMNTYKELKILTESSETIYSISVTSDNLYVIYGKYNGDLGVVSIDQQMSEVSISAHKGVVNSVCVSSSNKYIVSGSRDGNMHISRLSENPEIQVLEGHKRKIYNLAVAYNSQLMASCSEDGTVFVWRFGVEDCEGLLKGHKGAVYAVIFFHDCRKIVTGGHDQIVYVWDLASEKIDIDFQGHSDAITCLDIDPKDLYILSGSNDNTINIWDIERKDHIRTLKGHTDRITCICSNYEFTQIATGSKDRTVRIWSIEGKEIKKLQVHDEEVTCLIYLQYAIKEKSRNSLKRPQLLDHTDTFNEEEAYSDKIISGSLDKTIKILNFNTLEVEYTFHCKREVFRMCLSNDKVFLFVQSSKRYITLLSVPDKQELITLYDLNDLSALALSPDKMWLAYTIGAKVYMVKSPLNKENTFTVLPYSYSYLFKVLIHRLLNNDKSQKVTSFSTYFVCPYNISLIHILTFVSHSKMLKRAIIQGGKFFKTRSGETPLYIALQRKSKICAEILINMFFSDKTSDNQYLFGYLKGLLPILNKSSLPSLHILYNQAFPKIDSPELPTFGTFVSSPPVVLLSETGKIKPNLFIPARQGLDNSLNDSEVEFRRSLVAVDLFPGSEHSIDFLESLLECSNTEVFRTEFIRTLLTYKWESIRWMLIVQAFFFFTLVVDLTVITFKDRSLISPILVELMLNTVFMVYEILQAFSGLGSYFSDIWNILDSSRIIFTYVHVILTLTHVDEIYIDVFLLMVNLTTWARFIGFLRIFKGTRYMIHMVREIVSSLVPFLAIFLISNFAAIFAFYSDSYGDNFGDWLMSTYQLSYGNWEFTQDDDLKYTIFFISSLFNTLVLLNLLIAILTDTYEKVSLQLDVVDMQELISLILDVDSILFFYRKSGRRMFIISCNIAGSYKKNKNFESETNHISKTVHEIDNMVKLNERNMQRLERSIRKFSSAKVTGKSDWILELVQSIKNDFVSLKTEMQAEIKQVKHDLSSVKTELKKTTSG